MTIVMSQNQIRNSRRTLWQNERNVFYNKLHKLLGETRRKARQADTERANDKQFFSMEEHRKRNVGNFGNQESRSLERYDLQRCAAGHLMMVIDNYLET